MKNTLFNRYGFFWVTLGLFLFSLAGHWLFGWYAFVEEGSMHGAEISISSYTIEMLRDTLENWQSEFLQLMWQVVGLSFLFYIGSSQSKEGDDRKEEKIDRILSILDKDADATLAKIDAKYPRV